VDNYEEKIYELRISVQNKETAVIAMEDKISEFRDEESYGSTSKTNLAHFNEVYELKAIHDRLALENSQLTLLNAIKDEEIERMKGLLERYGKEMEKRE
jgi:hypothetical protein